MNKRNSVASIGQGVRGYTRKAKIKWVDMRAVRYIPMVQGFLWVRRLGGVSIKQSSLPGGPNILYRSDFMWSSAVKSATISNADFPFLSLSSISGPLNNTNLTTLIVFIYSTARIAKCSGVHPSLS